MPSTFEGEVLLLNNADVEKLLTIERVLAALDEAYLELDKGLTANRPRTLTFSPTDHGRFVANTHEGLMRSKAVYDIRIVTHSRPDPKADPSRVNYFHGALNCSLDNRETVKRVLMALIEATHFFKTRKEESKRLPAKYSKQNNEAFLESSYVGNEPIYERVPLVTREGMEIQIKKAIGRLPNINLKTDDIIDDSLVLQLEREGFIERLYRQ